MLQKWHLCAQLGREIKIQRGGTFEGSERDATKTHWAREIDLEPDALVTLGAMEPYTPGKSADDGTETDSFENQVTNRRRHDERSQQVHYWHPAMWRSGIRQRRADDTRPPSRSWP